MSEAFGGIGRFQFKVFDNLCQHFNFEVVAYLTPSVAWKTLNSLKTGLA